jgi:hypothetical protein
MIRLASVIDTFESAFLAQYRERLLPEHRRALAAMKLCRTQASPKLQANCTQCAHRTLVPHSCGHRHCPHCQHHESQQWIERQLAKQVPAQYFLLTFTLPAQFRALAWAHQGVLYELLLLRIPAMADTESGDGGQRRSEATQVGGLSLRVSAMGVEGRVFSK